MMPPETVRLTTCYIPRQLNRLHHCAINVQPVVTHTNNTTIRAAQPRNANTLKLSVGYT